MTDHTDEFENEFEADDFEAAEIVAVEDRPVGHDEIIAYHRERLYETPRAVWDDIENASREARGKADANADEIQRRHESRDADRVALTRLQRAAEGSPNSAQAATMARLEKRIALETAAITKLQRNHFAVPFRLDLIEAGVAGWRLPWRFKPDGVEVKGEPAAFLKKSRPHIIKLQKNRDSLANGPLPVAEAVTGLRADVRRKGIKSNASGCRFAYEDRLGRVRQGEFLVPKIKIGDREFTDPDALLLYLHDLIVAFHEREFSERGDEGTISIAERRDRIAEIDEAIRLAVRQDCAAVRALRASGRDVAFLPDAPVEAVLGIVRGPNAELAEPEPPFVAPDEGATRV